MPIVHNLDDYACYAWQINPLENKTSHKTNGKAAEVTNKQLWVNSQQYMLSYKTTLHHKPKACIVASSWKGSNGNSMPGVAAMMA